MQINNIEFEKKIEHQRLERKNIIGTLLIHLMWDKHGILIEI